MTDIGYSAFNSCSSLTSVTIGNSIKNIGSDAFAYCSKLDSVYITDLAAYLNINFSSSSNSPMYYAKNLYVNNKKVEGAVTIPDGVTKIPMYAFYGCDGITSITIPDSLTSIGSEAFYGCSSLKEVYYNGSYKEVGKIKIELYNNDYFINSTIHCSDFSSPHWGNCGDMAAYFLDDNGTLTISGMGDMRDSSIFYNNSNIKSVIIEDGITHIGFRAFIECRNLKSVTIPSSVTSAGMGAFHNCTNLESVYVTDLTAYLNTDFNSYTTASDIEYEVGYFPDGCYGSNPMYYANKLYINGKRVSGTITIPDGITKIPYAAFNGCDGITNIIIPSSVTSIGREAFSGCTGLKGVYITDLAAWCNINFNPNRYYRQNSNPLLSAHNLYLNNKLVTNLVIPNNVTSISEGAFSGCSSLKSVTIPDGITNIDIGVFSDCDNITRVTIPDSVMNINDYAFSGCSSLTSVTIPDSVTSIGKYAFSACSGLKSIVLPNSVTSIGYYAFSDCSGLASISIPNSVTSIGSYAFRNCSDLTNVTIPSSVTSIGSSAFYGCSGLTTLNYNAQKLFSDLFSQEYYYGKMNIVLAILGNNTTSIEENAFKSCNELRRVFIPKSVIEIEKAAFKDCTKLTTIEYGGSQSDWDEIYIGTENENLTNAKIIYNSLSANTTLTDLDYLTYTKNDDNTITITACNPAAININIPKEIDGLKVTAVGYEAFDNCRHLTTITIPNSIKSIESYAFYDCDNLKDVYFTGTETEWKAINISWSNENLTSANIHYNETAPAPTPTPTPTYTIKYDANGGSGAPSSQSAKAGTAITVSSQIPKRTGYDFLGWSTSKTAVTATYSAGDSITVTSNLTLYAVWSKIPMPDTTGNEITISNAEINDDVVSFTLELVTTHTMQGTVLVGVYDEGGTLVNIMSYPAEEINDISFTNKDNDSTVKVFWWYDSDIIFPMARNAEMTLADENTL